MAGYDRSYYRNDRDYEARRRKEEVVHQKMEEVNRRMEDVSWECVRVLHETQAIATDTSEELERQGETLDRTEQRLDEMEVDLEASKRSMREVKSVFGSVVNHFSKPKLSKDPTPSKRKSSPPRNSSRGQKGGGGTTQTQKQSTGNAVVDRNLDQLELGLKQLEGQAYLIGHQLDESNDQIDRIKVKVDRNDVRMRNVTRDAKRQLK